MRIRVGDHDVYAYTGSRLADRAAHNMVFVHGSANDHSVFALQSRYFAYHGCNVYAVDLPGHGNSAGQALRGVELLADWLIAFLDAAAVSEAALIGHSLGSLAVLETAARHPDRVTRNAMRLMERARPNVLHADLVACRDYANGLRAAAAVQCPSLMLLGAHDTMAPARGARELAATLRNVNVVTLDCGHSMMSEQPAPVLDALRQFLL